MVWQTVSRIFQGLVLSMVIGTAIGLVMGLRRDLEAFLDSWIMVLLTFPAICWAFLAVLWFGLSEIAPLLTVLLIVFPFVSMNVWEGTKAVEKALIDMAPCLSGEPPAGDPEGDHPAAHALSVLGAPHRALAVVEDRPRRRGVRGWRAAWAQRLVFWFEDTRVDMMLAWGISFMVIMTLIDLLIFRLWEKRTFVLEAQICNLTKQP